MIQGRSLAVLATLAFTLAACGGGQEPGDAAARPATSSAGPRDPALEATRGMVSGVSAGKPEGAAVDLKFDIKSRPELGQPLTIDIALLPKVASDIMRATFISTEGLSIRASEVPAEYRQVQPGSVHRHQLTLVPRDEGVYYVSAIVMVQTPAGELARTFSIPVVVGAPPETEAAAQ